MTVVRPNVRPGVLLALGAATGSALGVVPYKLATRQAEAAHVVLVLMFSAALLNTAASVPALLRHWPGRLSTGQVCLRSTLRAGLWMGALAAVANYASSEAVARLDAAVASLLIQLQVLFAAWLGWAWLGEQVGVRFILGALVAVCGVALMQLDHARDAGEQAGLWFGLVGAACFGSMQVVVRRYIHRLQPVWTNGLRLWMAVGLLAAVPGALHGALHCPREVIALAAASAFCGPFLGRLMMMLSARHIPAARSTLLGLSTPVLALLADWWVLDSLPRALQCVGGAVVVMGMLFALVPGRQVDAPQAASR